MKPELRSPSPNHLPPESFSLAGNVRPLTSGRHRVQGLSDYPPIMGASGEEPDTPEKARAVFEHYYSRTWAEWRKDSEKELRKTVRELNRLRRKYPEEFAAFLVRRGMDVEEWQHLEGGEAKRPRKRIRFR